MNIKRFHNISKLLSVILKIAAIGMLTGIILGVFFINLYNMDVDFTSMIENPLFQTSSYTGDTAVYLNVISRSVQIQSVIEIAIISYVYWKGSQLFSELAQGENPFIPEFAETTKKISLILIISDLIFPLILSLLISIQLDNGYFFMIDTSTMLLFGLMVYIISGILYYGVELQGLADEIV